tara:strand:- start:302 stop:733 length:432 start_codon:yes stop_codon:yes gene_type:complete
MIIKEITHEQALEWISKQDLEDTWHKDFKEWKKHLILAAKYWPWVKKFYRGKNKWLGAFDDELCGVYWYTIVENEMYDGFLISKKRGVGLKLGRELVKITKGQWKKNWTMCSKEYLKFNNRLGFQGTSYANITPWYEVYLLWR